MIEKIMNIQVTFAQALLIILTALFLTVAAVVVVLVKLIEYIVRKIAARKRKREEERYTEEIKRRGRELLQNANVGIIEYPETVVQNPDQAGK